MKIRASNFLDAFFMPILERGENRGRSVSVVGPMVILVLFSVRSIDERLERSSRTVLKQPNGFNITERFTRTDIAERFNQTTFE